MLPGDLDLRISIFEGSAPRISALLLYARLLAAPGEKPDGPSEYLILGRDPGGGTPSWMIRSDVAGPDVERLVALLRAAGLPGRAPRVVANESLLGAGPYLALEARVGGRSGSVNLPMQNSGFSGADSGALRAVLRQLAELAPAARRPAVRELVERLAIDRAAAVGPGRLCPGAARVPIGAGWPAGDSPACVLFEPTGRDGDRRAMPAAPRGALADR